jgi:hypothetical protein
MSNTTVVVAPVVVEPVVAPVVLDTVKAPKKPSLPAKYSKFLSFGFWFASRLEPDARDALYGQFKLFSSIEEQSEFFQTYLNEASASNKIMRKTIANHNKPVKTRATKASRKPSKPVAAETDDLIATLIADANGEPAPATNTADKPKKTRKPKSDTTDKPKKEKKSKKNVSEPVSEPVVETVASEPVAEPVVQPVAEPVAKKTTKPKAEKPKAEKVEKPKAEKPKAEKPKKEKKDKKTVEELPVVTEQPVEEQPVDDSDDSIQAHIVQMNGSQYLMDSENNLYDINSHEVVGKYNPDTQSVTMN